MTAKLRAGDPGLIPDRTTNFLLAMTSTLVLQLVQSSIEVIPGKFTSRIKRPEPISGYLPPSKIHSVIFCHGTVHR